MVGYRIQCKNCNHGLFSCRCYDYLENDALYNIGEMHDVYNGYQGNTERFAFTDTFFLSDILPEISEVIDNTTLEILKVQCQPSLIVDEKQFLFCLEDESLHIEKVNECSSLASISMVEN